MRDKLDRYYTPKALAVAVVDAMIAEIGHLPRPLTDEERHRAQLATLGARSLADASPQRLAAVDARLSAASPQAIAWALWLHGVLGGESYDVEERLAIKIHDGGMTEEQARATLIIETS